VVVLEQPSWEMEGFQNKAEPCRPLSSLRRDVLHLARDRWWKERHLPRVLSRAWVVPSPSAAILQELRNGRQRAFLFHIPRDFELDSDFSATTTIFARVTLNRVTPAHESWLHTTFHQARTGRDTTTNGPAAATTPMATRAQQPPPGCESGARPAPSPPCQVKEGR
jgi:hypothetical protein